MAFFLVTDDAIKVFLSEVLNENKRGNERKTHRNVNMLSELGAVLQGIDIEKIIDAEYQFSQIERTLLFAALNKIIVPGDGKLVPPEFALEVGINFQVYDGQPAHIVVLDKVVEDFLELVNDYKNELIDREKAVFDRYEVAFRLYFGHTVEDSKKIYKMVAVPICTLLLTNPNDTRNHEKDLENIPFRIYSKCFFALILEESSARITHDPSECAAICKWKDHASCVELSFCTLEMFNKFRNGVDSASRKKMNITLGRLIGDGDPNTKDDPITQVVSFSDEKGKILESKFSAELTTYSGFCFDQNSLIPPPFPVSDPSF